MMENNPAMEEELDGAQQFFTVDGADQFGGAVRTLSVRSAASRWVAGSLATRAPKLNA